MGLFGKSLMGFFLDESSLGDDFDKLLKEYTDMKRDAMMIDPTMFLQQHILPSGGLNHGNWATTTQAHSNTSNIPDPTQQGALSAQSTQDALTALAQHHSQQGALQNLIMHGIGVDFAAPQKPIEHVGTKFGEFLGWRMWYVVRGMLKSYSQRTIWKPKVPMTGEPSDHEHDGIWAFKEKKRAIKKSIEALQDYYTLNLNQFPGSMSKPIVIWGSIKLYGDVIEHEDGYRASVASIVSLDDAVGDIKDPFERDQLLTMLRKKYLP